MIAHLKGVLLKKTTDSLIIDINGVGYEVFVPLSTFYTLPEEDERISLNIYTHVKEDAFVLFGFKTILEKRIFRLLISVSGIGPRLAINILSGIGPVDLIEAIAHGDVVKLQSIPGIGKKTAERIALELKDKAGKIGSDLNVPLIKARTPEDKTVFDDALSALINLGYQTKSAKIAVEKAVSLLADDTVSLEIVIKEALRQLA